MSNNQEEQYPEHWIHATIHLNTKNWEIHSEGNHDVRSRILQKIDEAREEGEINMLEYSKDGLETIHQTWDLLVSPKDHIERQIKLLNKHIKQLKAKYIKE